MNKLLYSSSSQSLDDSAKYLTKAFDEEITTAAVLRFALDKRLRLSVKFLNLAKAKYCKVVQYTQEEMDAAMAANRLPQGLEWGALPSWISATDADFFDEKKGKRQWHVKNMHIGDGKFISVEEADVQTIDGVWDLLMEGGAEMDIESRYQTLKGGPAVSLVPWGGVIVYRPNGKICQLQDRFDPMEYTRAWGAHRRELEQYIADNHIEPLEGDEILNEHDKERKEKLEKIKLLPPSKYYFGGNRLPKDSELVVRTEALEEFVQKEKKNLESPKPLLPTERNTLLTVIGALCSHLKINPKTRGSSVEIARMTEIYGKPVSDDTVRRVLDKISGELEDRSK